MSSIKSIYSIIQSPLVTEKTSRLIAQRQYVFAVAKDANRIEIKNAVEKIHNVKVEKVATMISKGKLKKIRWNQPGRTTDWKKAIVTLKEGQEIKVT